MSTGVGGPAQATAKVTATTTTVLEKHKAIDPAVVPTPAPKAYSGGYLMAADPNGGYWTVSWLGVVTPHDGAPALGDPALSGIQLAKPIIGMAATPDGAGYWLVASDGGIFTYGDAKFYGSTGGMHLNEPVVGMAATSDGDGYWLVASDGGIFTFGDATFYGSAGSMHLNQPIAGMAATSDGDGYWLVANDGGIFTYGDAKFFGSAGDVHLNKPVIAMAATPDGAGYWLVASDGGIFTYGDAQFDGTLGGNGGALGIIINPASPDYTLVQGDGTAVAPTTVIPAVHVAPPSSSTTTTAPKAVAPAPRVKAPTTTAPVPKTTVPAPTTTTTHAPVSAGGVPAPPTVSANPLYPLEQVTSFETGTIPANLVDYGDLVLPPEGYIASSHLVPTSGGLEVKGYPDAISGGVGGVTGAGFNLSEAVPNSGGFDVCFSMSAGDWQNVHLVLISWPVDQVWGDGELDFFEGDPQDMAINVHEIGSDPANTTYQGTWPAALASGVHVVSARWDPVNGYNFYLDGQLVEHLPIGANYGGGPITTPTVPHELAIQMQDTTQSSTSAETATIYWTARYGYNG